MENDEALMHFDLFMLIQLQLDSFEFKHCMIEVFDSLKAGLLLFFIFGCLSLNPVLV